MMNQLYCQIKVNNYNCLPNDILKDSYNLSVNYKKIQLK